MLNPGHVLQQRYHIETELGRGGMGAVYKAVDLRLNIAVAIKELTAQTDLDTGTLQDLRDQFKQEATVLARLSHPHLVGVTDFFQEGRNVYLVMQYIEGMSLSDIIKRDGALREDQVLIWAAQLLDALSYCHSQGVIHRDIKPQNIIINPSGQAVLVDFGLVKLWDPNDPKTHTVVRGIGTPQYAPPEQYETTAGHTEPRSDIFSLGATLYHALTGQSPPTATLRIASPEEYIGVKAIQNSVSSRSASAIERAMELARSRRWSTAVEMASAFGIQIYDWGMPQPVRDISRMIEKGSASHTRVMRGGTGNKRKRISVWWWLLGVSVVFVIIAGTILLITAFTSFEMPNILALYGPEITPTTILVNSPTATKKPSSTPTISVRHSDTPTTTSTPTVEPETTEDATQTPTPTQTPSPKNPTATVKPTNTSQPAPTVKPSPTTAIQTTGNFYNFENFSPWHRGDQPYGEFIQSSEQYKGGSYSGKLTYDFPDVTDDYVVFTNIIGLVGQPNQFSAFVYGDGSNHFLNFWIQDAGNEIWSVHLGTIPGPGWHQLAGELAPNLAWPNGHIAGPDNGIVDYPIRFHSIVLDRPDTGPRQGTIYIDRLAFIP